ncbi:hypothetical protein F5Y05DRAFT_170141 [Hypoxylon sp. FL0543]|nr:hypothetical protein F5Y05DRAFT_170141 [Hypoxylon sp. FL0543]
MAKNKKGGVGSRFKSERLPHRKGRPAGNLSGGYGGNNSFPASQGFSRAHGYTLADEARNTASNRRGALGRDAKLRYKPVTFISAGLMDPLKDLNVQLTTGNDSQEGTNTMGELPATTVTPTTDTRSFEDYGPASSVGAKSHLNQQLAQELPTHGDPSVKTARKPARPSAPESDNSEDSSEEVVLFKGRDRRRQKPAPARVDPDDPGVNSLELRELDLELQAVEETLHQEGTETDDYIPLGQKAKGKPEGRGKQRKFYQSATSDEDAAIIADYMANIKGLEEGEEEQDSERLGVRSHAFSILRDLGGTDSDAVPNEVSSEDGTDHDSEHETDAETLRHRLEADDERMARTLAKQEELGLGSDDILLFNGEGSDVEWLTPTQATPGRKKKGESKRAKIVHKQGQYPSATAMADAFDELDLMDWHRPSLNNFKKGPPTFDISDSELEEAMKSTWQKDRLKKAEKKKAREELRSQGLLGKNVDPDDPRVKYPGGMSLDDIANELEMFLLGSREQLILPPLDKGARKTVHAIANKLKIKSQSAGKGKDRYPVLYRTKATLPFDQVTFDKTFARTKQTWFPRVDVDDEIVNTTRVLKRTEARNGKSRFKSSLTYRDGDVVGQHAAEIGAENKGRAMLEKMGWSKGMALGTGENKGIMVPITHVVKKSKAGLGDA